MRLTFYLYLVFLWVLLGSVPVKAQTITACPATQPVLENVDFEASNCIATTIQDYVMTGRSAWITMPLVIPEELLISQKPIGLFISGHMSNQIYLNDKKIGENGTPSLEANNEVSGQFDTVFYVPRTAIDGSENQLTLYLSSHNAQREYLNPFNRIYVDVYQADTTYYLKHYMPTLIPLGVMLLSLIYIIRRMLLEPKSLDLAYLMLLTLTATLQLVVEVSRGLYAYTYPWHDIRLNLIWFLACTFGISLLVQTLNQFTHIKKRFAIGVGLVLLITWRLIETEPDLLAAYSMMFPALLTAVLIAYENFTHQKTAYGLALILFAFSALIYFAPYNFLDVYLYYCIAALLAYLFTYEAKTKVQQQDQLSAEKQRAEKLQLALEIKTQESNEQTITFKDSGKLIRAKAEEVLYCQGAGDYVEVALINKTILHSGSLNGLSKELPSYFIKVHRSYIVNAKHISHMRRLPSGTGELELSNSQIIPISRRLLPSLKETLSSQ